LGERAYGNPDGCHTTPPFANIIISKQAALPAIAASSERGIMSAAMLMGKRIIFYIYIWMPLAL
jgi:hypothetical protein